MNKIIITCIGIFTLSFGQVLFAQNYQLITYQTDDGLSTNLTKAIIRDKIGFMWVVSDEGVSRFDGRKFINFKKELPSNYTKSIFLSKKGRILVSNDLGVIEILTKPDTSFFKTSLQGATNTSELGKVMYPKEIFEDCQNNFWISEPNSVLFYTEKKMKRYLLPRKMNTTVYLRSFHFAELGCGRLFMASFKGFLMYFDTQKDLFVELSLPNSVYLNDISAILAIDDRKLWVGDSEGIIEINISPSNQIESAKRIFKLPNVSHLKRDNKGNILVGTWNSGLYKIFKDSNEELKLNKFVESRATVINHIYVDIEANIWVCSDDGLELLKPNEFNVLQINEKNSFIEAITLTGQNTLLACDGTYIHEIIPDEKKQTFEKKPIYNYPNTNIHAVAKSGNKIFVGAGDDKVICLEKGNIKEIEVGKYGRSVFSLFADNQGNIWVCQYGREQGVLKLLPDFTPVFYSAGRGIDSLVYVVKQDVKGKIYAGSKGKTTYLYQYIPEKDNFENISVPLSLPSKAEFIVNDIFFDNQSQIWIASNQGVWIWKDHKIRLLDLGKTYQYENMTAIWIDEQDNVWIGTKLGIIKYKDNRMVLFEKVNGLSTVTVSNRGILQDQNGKLFVATANGLNYLNEKSKNPSTTPSPIFLTIFANNLHTTDSIGDFAYQTTLDFTFQSFTYPNNRVLYQYRIVGLQDDWSEPTYLNRTTIERIPNGQFTLEIRSKQQGNFTWSQPLRYSFTIQQAWYFSWWAILLYILAVLAVMVVLVNLYTLRLKKQRENLQVRISEATKEIELRASNLREANELLHQQKEEINQQKENIETQKETIESAYRIIERNNRKIVDSIRYAKTIQQIILPPENILKNLFKDYFLIYRPKDVVSGDFYWALKVDNKTFVAVVDCTGHGVPGAFMSMIGYTLLHRIIKLKGFQNPAKILELLHAEVRVVLKQKETSNSDGMDMCLCVLERIEHPQFGLRTKVRFTGAKRPLYYFTNGSLEILDEDRKSIGGIQNQNRFFNSQAVVLHEGDIIYLSTDGLIDQNNHKRKKFGENQFSRILEKNASLPMCAQKEILEKTLDTYQNGSEQRDDITVLGIKI